MAEATVPRAPAGLGSDGRRLWREVTSVFVLDPHEAAILRAACVISDVLGRLSAELSAAPAIVSDSGRVHRGAREYRAGVVVGQVALGAAVAGHRRGPHTAAAAAPRRFAGFLHGVVMRRRREARVVPPEELLDFPLWCANHGVVPRARWLPVPVEDLADEAQFVININERVWAYDDWIAARVDWAGAHGFWPVLSWFGNTPDRPDQPRSDYFAQRPAEPSTQCTLPHRGRWSADDDGNISCLEHGLRSDQH